MIYIIEDAYAGFLTAVFESFERKHFDVKIRTKEEVQISFFEEVFDIQTDSEKAKRVLKGLKSKVGDQTAQSFYRAFLSEDHDARDAAFYIIQKIFTDQPKILSNFGDDRVILFDKTLTKIRREAHRMKAFIRFQKSSDGQYYAIIDPDFNVLPLIVSFFKKRYADQSWLIYDVKRNYGVFFDQSNLIEVQLSTIQKDSMIQQSSSITLDEKEEHFQNLWKQYFKSTNIEARKNMKLHLQHVPRRYWKYLVEKQ